MLIKKLFIYVILFSCCTVFADEWKKEKIDLGLNKQDILKSYDSYIYYKDDKIESELFITEFFYTLETNQSVAVLGGFNKTSGFYDSKKQSISKKKTLNPQSDFMRNRLLGIAPAIIKNPLVITGIAKDMENNIYQTEVLEVLAIDFEKFTIVEFIPKW